MQTLVTFQAKYPLPSRVTVLLVLLYPCLGLHPTFSLVEIMFFAFAYPRAHVMTSGYSWFI
jgi:hypothetical protein